MKKIILFNILIIFLIKFSIAQPYISINIKGAKRINQFFLINYGKGLNINAGFLIKQKFNPSVSVEKIWFNTTTDFLYNYRINSVKANIRYLFLTQSVRPYISFGAGYFQSRYGYIYDPNYKDPGVGIIPSIGILFDSEIIKNLYINTNLSYYKVNTEYPISLLNFDIGILYYFESKK